ncbi:hypothetical protein [Paraburkholderia adhaesiva]|uniref:hypothetical protein n=1 Tax=Paraburkholderia adhaesiva TaxID=2883244 RepID=UPI001F1B4F69|nr:hypothetical protein [Paraburkholderia adhaesiva]
MPEITCYGLHSSTDWPYRFTLIVNPEHVTPELVDEDSTGLIDALAWLAERQHLRLKDSDYSALRVPYTVDVLLSGLVAITFDPRGTDAQGIRRDAAFILSTLRREIERVGKASTQ